MDSKLIFFSFVVVFSRFASGPTFSNEQLLFGSFESSIFDTFWNKIRQILGGFWHLGSCMHKEVSRYLHNCCRMTYLSLSGPNMDPSWLQLASSWVHAGPKLVPTWLKLGPCWTKIRVPSRPWANPSPSRPIPWSLLASQTPTCVLQHPKYIPKGSPTLPTSTQNTPKM